MSPICDWQANAGRRRIQLILVLFRLCGNLRSRGSVYRLWGIGLTLFYRFLSQSLYAIDLPVQVKVGPRLEIHHGFGIVVNGRSVLGEGVVLRQGVTLGSVHAGGAAPRLGDHVDVGAGAILLGDIEVGHSARIGAGAVVLKNVEAMQTVVGVPAAPIKRVNR